MAACLWAYPKSFTPLNVPRACGQSWSSSRWGGHWGVGPALPVPWGSSAQAEGLQQGCPFTRGRELGVQPQYLSVHSCVTIFCASLEDLIWSALFSSTAVEICHQFLHRLITLSSSPPCPLPPYWCPSTFPLLNRTQQDILNFPYLFFFLSPLLCPLVTAFGISRTARTP